MPKNTTERIIDRPLSGRQTARVWSGSSGSASTGTGGNATTDALLAVPFLTLTADTTLTNERYLDVTNGLTKFDEGAGARLLLALEVPGTLTVSSTNTSTGNHTHAITSSSNPGAAASILASSAAGDLTLPTLTATTHVRTPLINTASGGLTIAPANSTTSVTGSLSASTKLTAPLIDTASGNLSIAPAGGTTAVTGALSLTGTLSSTSWSITSAGAAALVTATASTKVTTPLIDTVSGNLELAPVGSVHISRPLGVGVASPIYPLQVAGSGFFSGQLYLSDGTVSAPGLSFPGDTNSGIHHAGEDAYALVAGGAKIANVGAAGVAINTPYDASAALMVQSAVGSDITALFKRIAGQTARIWRITDENDHDLIILDDEGNLESGNPGFFSGLTGWQLAATGDAEFNNAWIRGELHASIFVADEFHASSGTTIFATAGKLLNDAIILGGNSVLIDIKDPAVGHARIFSVGDRLRAKAIGALNIPNSGTIYPSFPGVISHAMNSNAGITTLDIWLQVAAISDMLTHWRYTCTRLSGSDGTLTAGTAIIRWGGIGDGLILATSDLNHAPYLDVFTSGAQPWAGDILPHARFGRLTGVGVLSQNHEWGMVAGTNLADNTQPYVVASNGGVDLYKVRLTLSDNSNPTVQMLPSGDVRFGRDVATSGGTGFHFDPATGNVTIGHYPDGQYLLWDQNTGSVTLNGNLIVDAPATAHWNNIVGRPTDESILNQYTTISDIAGLDAISGDYRDVVSAEILTSITGALTVSVTAGSSIKFRGGAYATKNLNTASIATLFTGYRTYVYVKAGNTNDNNIYSTNVLSTLSVNDVLIGLIIGGAEKASWQALWGKTFIGDNSIVTGAILANHIKAGAITADAIAANAITANAIASGSVTAAKLNIGTLQAVTALTGDLTVSGTLSAGGGKTLISSNGIAIGRSDYLVEAPQPNSIHFYHDPATLTNSTGYIWNYYDAFTVNRMHIVAENYSSFGSSMYLATQAYTGADVAAITLDATNTTGVIDLYQANRGYVAGTLTATGYFWINVNGVAVKVLVAT